MKDIAKYDKNVVVKTEIDKDDVVFFNIRNKPFKVYGIFYEDGKFRRMPEAVAKNVNDGVYQFHADTTGGRVKFKTNSPYVAISAQMSGIGKMPHFAFTGSAGFDLYVKLGGKDVYYHTFRPPLEIEDGYESAIDFTTVSNIPDIAENEEKEITINFPIHSEVCDLYIGISEKATLSEADEYKIKKPILYYGSSVTQGGCASRPGNIYQSIISRRFDCDYINLGFSGSAKGETEMAEYIKQQEMSIFVYDYDYNAPNAEYLSKTHEKMFKTIRTANPDLPIIILPRPKFYLGKEDIECFEVIKATYDNAIESGDKNVYLIPSAKLTEGTGNEGTVDNCHPNDFGFCAMAKAIGDVIEKILMELTI